MATEKKTSAKKTTAKKTAAKACAKKTAAKKTVKAAAPKHIGLVKNDPYLADFEPAIVGRHEHALWKLGQLTRNGKITLSDFANGYDYFGLHKTEKGWVFREWAPNATDIYLVGDFNNWQESPKYRAKRIKGTGNWELKMPEKASESLHGPTVWFRTSRPRFSLHRCGARNLTSGRRRPSSLAPLRCSSTSATSEWDRMPRRWAPTRNSRKTCCHVSLRTVTTASRSWLSRSILTTAPSATT